MGDVHEAPRPRIAAAQLVQHIGRPVCFVGRVEKVRMRPRLLSRSALGKRRCPSAAGAALPGAGRGLPAGRGPSSRSP